MKIEFFIPGEPQARQSVHFDPRRKGKKGYHKDDRAAAWLSTCRIYANCNGPSIPFAGPIRMIITIWRSPPKGKHHDYPIKRPDLTNYIKPLEDIFNGVIWNDDSQVVELIAKKLFINHGKVGICVQIWEIEE
jgi:Holliday junction resolvase RusA-like endonuclease